MLLILSGVAAFSGCGLVDEDMDDCETDYGMAYELRMVTNMTTEISTQLSLAADVSIANSLKTYIAGVFTDHAQDVDLSFYDVVADPAVGDQVRLHHEAHTMNASQSSYTLYIPIRKYMHLAVANVAGSDQISLVNDGMCHSAQLQQEIMDTVDCQRSGLFTARLPMDIKAGEDQEFNVNLYMANCASSLVVDTLGSGVRKVDAYASGFATGFSICDSTYTFAYTPIVRADRLSSDPGSLCFATVNFPSRDVDAKSVIETSDPFVSTGSSEGALWRYRVYATMPDGSVTETILGVSSPLRAGQLKIIKVKILPNGSAATSDPAVGVSVTLDWEGGSEVIVEV